MMNIGNFNLFEGGPTFIVAELSANHNQDKEIAINTIRMAKSCGADAIKLQTYTPDTLTIDCSNEFFRIEHGTLWDGKSLYDLYKEAYTPWEWHQELFKIAKEEGLICFSSPFDRTAVDFLEELNVPAYKIASFEIKDVPLIKYVASKGKPIIISTGIATLEDIELALSACRSVGNDQIILLKCTSSYPAPLELANLNTMSDMRSRFKVLVGLSDHTIGNTVPSVAAALGASMIEKHFIIDKSLGGPDSEFSLDPAEFTAMANEVRNVERALGKITYDVPEKVKLNVKFARSLFVVRDVKKGELISNDNVRSIRPGYGLHPKHAPDVLGRLFSKDIQRGTPLSWDSIQK